MFNFITKIMTKKTGKDLPKMEDVKDAAFKPVTEGVDMSGMAAIGRTPSDEKTEPVGNVEMDAPGELRHVSKALMLMSNPETIKWIDIENPFDEKGVAPIVKFTVQSDPISEVGVNGLQAVDIIEFSKCLIQSLHDVFPCKENEETIKKLEAALMWQEKRTQNRIARNVEGKNEN